MIPTSNQSSQLVLIRQQTNTKLPLVKASLILLWLLAMTGCDNAVPSSDSAQSGPVVDARTEVPPQPQAQKTRRNTHVYRCDNRGELFRLITRTGPGELAVWLPPRFEKPYLVLGQTVAASGVKYSGDGVVVWIKGNSAMLEVAGERITGCQEDVRASIWEHAKLSGVDFRAVGNEPGWHLEIRDGRRIDFTYSYGAESVSMPASEPTSDSAARTAVYQTQNDAHDLTVVLEGTTCSDTMSGEVFETRVSVVLDGTEFYGCGRALH